MAAKQEPGKIAQAFIHLTDFSKFCHFFRHENDNMNNQDILSNPVLDKDETVKEEEEEEDEEDEEEEESAPGSTIFIKNLNFSTIEEKLEEVGQFINTALVHIIWFDHIFYIV